jgi:hypothetical protein
LNLGPHAYQASRDRSELLGAAILLATLCAGCGPTTAAPPDYVLRGRDVTITTVPLLVKELGRTYPFLAKDFAKGGVLDATYVARRAGIFSFTCSIQSHLPSMWGQLIVLAPESGSDDRRP